MVIGPAHRLKYVRLTSFLKIMLFPLMIFPSSIWAINSRVWRLFSELYDFFNYFDVSQIVFAAETIIKHRKLLVHISDCRQLFRLLKWQRLDFYGLHSFH